MAITTLLEDERVLNPDGSDAHRIVLLANDDAGDSVEITGAQVPGLNIDDVIAAGSTLITPSANYVAFEDGVFSKKSGGGSGSGGGSALPAVTSADNGKVLSVVDGAWAKDDKLFIATYNGHPLVGTPITCEKTFSEIVDAYNAGKDVWAYSAVLGFRFRLAGVGYQNNAPAALYFWAVGMSEGRPSRGVLYHYANESIGISMIA